MCFTSVYNVLHICLQNFANVLTQNVNAETNGSINVTNVSVYVSISVNKCINKRIKSYFVKIRSYSA